MKYLVVPVLLLLTAVVACKSLKNEGGVDWATVEFTVQEASHNSSSRASSSGNVECALIIAIPQLVGTMDLTNYIFDHFASGMLDFSNGTVSLRSPLNIAFRIVKVTFRTDYTLSQILTGQPTAYTIGISDPLTIKGDTEKIVVVIKPFIQIYTVGGTVSGLNGSLTLQNDGGNTLTVTTDSSFTFPDSRYDGAPYTVTMTTYPSNQNCALSNGSGTINGADVTNVRVTCSNKTWGTAELIETDNTGTASYPQVAFDASGNAIAVWHHHDGTRENIMSNRYVAGTGWGTAELIETNNTGPAEIPQFAIDPSGNAVAVWRQDEGARNIWANRYAVGTGWSTNELIETDNAGNAWHPQVAIDPNGNALAVWQQSDGTRENILANRYVVGTGWGTAELIETDNAGSAVRVQIAIDPSGNAIAVWNQYDGTRQNIRANRYVAGTGWDTAELIETDNAGDALYSQVAIDLNGNAMAVWQQNDGTRDNIWANRYVAGTGWGTAELIETDNAGDAISSQVAFDPSGNAMTVWQQNDGTRDNIWANRYVAGTGWGTAEMIETDNAGDATAPQIAFDSGGNALVVWYQNDGTRTNIRANQYVTGTGWGTAELIETDNAGDAVLPQVAFDSGGNALAVWYQNDGTRANIWANRFQ